MQLIYTDRSEYIYDAEEIDAIASQDYDGEAYDRIIDLITEQRFECAYWYANEHCPDPDHHTDTYHAETCWERYYEQDTSDPLTDLIRNTPPVWLSYTRPEDDAQVIWRGYLRDVYEATPGKTYTLQPLQYRVNYYGPAEYAQTYLLINEYEVKTAPGRPFTIKNYDPARVSHHGAVYQADDIYGLAPECFRADLQEK